MDKKQIVKKARVVLRRNYGVLLPVNVSYYGLKMKVYELFGIPFLKNEFLEQRMLEDLINGSFSDEVFLNKKKLPVKMIRPKKDKLDDVINPTLEDKEKFYRSRAWQRLRYDALRKYKSTCCCCGRRAKDGYEMHVDHIVPLSVDWRKRLDPNNVQVLCADCNRAKSNLDSTDFR